MAEFMDVHRGMVGISPLRVFRRARRADLAMQGEENINYADAWADPKSGLVFCLSEAAPAPRPVAHSRARRSSR